MGACLAVDPEEFPKESCWLGIGRWWKIDDQGRYPLGASGGSMNRPPHHRNPARSDGRRGDLGLRPLEDGTKSSCLEMRSYEVRETCQTKEAEDMLRVSLRPFFKSLITHLRGKTAQRTMPRVGLDLNP